MRTKSIKLRECLRCQYGKRVLQDVISKLEKRGSYINTERLIADCPCFERLMKPCRILERVWFPDEIFEEKYQIYEQTVLMDMLTECQMYTDMIINADEEVEGSTNWKTDYVNNGTAVMKSVSEYSGLRCEEWVNGDDENRQAELAELLPTIRTLIKDFSKIKYSKQFLEYRNKNLKPKSGEPEVTILHKDCTHRRMVDGSKHAYDSFMEYVQLSSRVLKLPANLQEVFWSVYDKAPTHFGANLTAIMEEKSMSANDVYMLVKPYSNNPKMRMSVVQSMMSCEYPTSNTNLIPYIARALLIEESVLLTGNGRSWGTFAYQLDTDFLKSTMENSRGMINSARDEVRAGIIKVIESDGELHDYLQEVSDWGNHIYRDIYAEETINLCPDRKQRWGLLRERESLLILLSCLEEQSARNG